MPAATVARWQADLRFLASTATGTDIELDVAGEPGTAKPSELLLAALCGCTGMDVIAISRKKRQRVTQYEVRARGEQRQSHPRTWESIVVEHAFVGETLDDLAISRSIKLSASRYCVVNAHLSSGDTRVSHRYTIKDGGGTRSADVVVTGPFGAGLERDSGPFEPQPPGQPGDAGGAQAPAATPGSERSAGPM